ncbi:SDR family oxidoreductase [Chiayiivirga flava]|uniref:NAD(P)-dependent dehydrogenase (Short-subunit alcohol dehydrogenase family) n=1 Tax=Chiayiivirga flava TaxID=659595 RepID=A0A7W8D8R2_9GAMM|nr:SDR family oxidoreductase [Chiayiivirga flava]MBB5209682.1 NAD(P)-dependent dehydrogenase (short-subunit alcohol dehydrogenase family) [Chiayiivirga flava]
MAKTPAKTTTKKAAGGTAAKHRKLQDAAMRSNEARPDKESKAPVQAGAREQPENPLPKQHQDKPGIEAKLRPKPKFLAPDYAGSGKLDGRVAIVTGGDSGIGRAVAVLFAREGADVAVMYLSEHEDAKETKARIEAEGRRCLLIAGDVKDSSFCDAAVAQTVKEFGRLDVLVNNAAFQQHVEAIEDLSDEQIDETFRTNIYGYMYMARAAVPHLGEGASIINTGSVTGLAGSKELLDYSSTKGAIHAFTMSLASQLLDRGIRVNAVAPGPVWTPLNPADRDAEAVAKFGEKSPMKRPAQPEELSPAFVFLAAPVCSSYITGLVLPVVGGPQQ